jgi:hypothetical protein
MAKLSREAQLRQAKEAKQKKFLFLLVPLFLGLVVWQGPKSYKALTGGAAPPPPPPPTTTTPSTTPTAPTATAPTGTGVSAAPGGSGLSETDPVVDPLEGQLHSFSRFESKDPFGGLSESAGGTTTAPTDGTGDGSAATGARASIDVNGASEDVAVGHEFPTGDPAFRLVSVSSRGAEIGIVSGSFSSGSDTIRMTVGETLVLVSETDGTRYVIRLDSVSG